MWWLQRPLASPISAAEGRPSSFTAHPRGRPCLVRRVVMAWIILFVAGLMEVGWAIGLKYTEGFTRLVPSVLTLACMAGSILLLGLALKALPIGTAYAVWTGIRAGGTATAARLACIGLIVTGIVGLKLVSGSA